MESTYDLQLTQKTWSTTKYYTVFLHSEVHGVVFWMNVMTTRVFWTEGSCVLVFLPSNHEDGFPSIITTTPWKKPTHWCQVALPKPLVFSQLIYSLKSLNFNKTNTQHQHYHYYLPGGADGHHIVAEIRTETGAEIDCYSVNSTHGRPLLTHKAPQSLQSLI